MARSTATGTPETAAQIVRSAGLRLTPQRTLVVEVLAGAAPAHLSADDVWRRVAGRYDGINRSTVYRVLDQLTEIGVVAQHRLGGSAARYELRRGQAHHHHLHCSECGAIADLDGDDLAALERRVRTRLGFVLADVAQTLEGVCPACQARPDGGGRQVPTS